MRRDAGSHCPAGLGGRAGRTFRLQPQQAGGLATLFLLGAVGASAFAAHRFNRVNQRVVATGGFAFAALSFFLASTQSGFVPLAALHLAAGISVGAALSMVHGTMGHAANPHRLFAMAGIAIGLFGIVLLGASAIADQPWRPVMFQVFGGGDDARGRRLRAALPQSGIG